jgi:hypothetical protein
VRQASGSVCGRCSGAAAAARRHICAWRGASGGHARVRLRHRVGGRDSQPRAPSVTATSPVCVKVCDCVCVCPPGSVVTAHLLLGDCQPAQHDVQGDGNGTWEQRDGGGSVTDATRRSRFGARQQRTTTLRARNHVRTPAGSMYQPLGTNPAATAVRMAHMFDMMSFKWSCVMCDV